jgi:hypothetical protein
VTESTVLEPSHDGAFVSTSEGLEFADWFDRLSITDDWLNFVDVIPLSRIYEVADVARRRAQSWTSFADALEGRVRYHAPGSCRDAVRLLGSIAPSQHKSRPSTGEH